MPNAVHAAPAISGPSPPERQGIGVIVADVSDPGEAGRTTAADFVLESIGEVQRFSNALAH